MRNTVLAVLALALSSCASNQAPPSLQESRPMPEAVTSPPLASEEGSLRGGLQTLQDATLEDLRKSFEVLQRDLEAELQSLRKLLRASPPPTAPAAATR